MKPSYSKRVARALLVPVALGVSAAVASAACSNGGGPGDASADSTAADARPCSEVREDDGGVRYTLCPSRVNPDCLRLEYPDGAVLDPTFC